jgi:Tat protein translocase TatC
MTIGEHLEELRRRLILGLVAVAVAFFACWFYREELLAIAKRPHATAMARLGILGESAELKVFTYLEAFYCFFKICGIAALLLGGPVLLWQMWRFVSAGLYEKERRLVRRIFPFSVGLFAAGALFGFYVLIPTALIYLAGIVPSSVGRSYRLTDYLTIVFFLTFALGLFFQLPLGMLVLSRVGLISAPAYRRQRKWFVLFAFVAAALATPGPDPVSQVLLAVPMVLLYELGILLAAVAGRRPAPDAPGAR